MMSVRGGLACLVAVFLVACGGGGGGGGNPPTPAASLSYPAQPAFTSTVAITPIVPAKTGNLTNFSINPGLPGGLVLDPATGVISGTPMQSIGATTYTVTAPNGSGFVTATIVLTVNLVPPNISYPRAAYTFLVDVPVNGIDATNTGHSIGSWSVSPALPAGVSLDTRGTITGVPTAITPRRTYRVTATNTGGSDSFDLDIEVIAPFVIDLGHTSRIKRVTFNGNRILSQDQLRRFVLWNAQSGAKIWSMTADCVPPNCATEGELAGPTFVIRHEDRALDQDKRDIYSSVDGSFIASIPFQVTFSTWWGLSTDGSYVFVAGSDGIRAYSRTGNLLFTHPGNYSSGSAASFFAAPDEIRVAGGPAGAQAVESIAVPSGAATLSPAFAGTFARWFVDGERFLTAAGNTARVYSRAAAQLDIAPLPTVAGLAGSGNWYWTISNTTRIYLVGSAGAAAATYANTQAFENGGASGNTLGFLTPGTSTVPPSLSVVDLSGVAPVKTDHVTPVLFPAEYAAASSSDWVIAANDGVLTGELGAAAPQVYSHGAVRSMAGSSGRLAFAMTSGEIQLYNAATRTLEDRIDWPSSQVALSADGSVLGAAANAADSQYAPDRTLRLYSLPSKTIISERPATFGAMPFPFDFQLSSSGTVVAQTIGQRNGTGWNVTFAITELDGDPIATFSGGSVTDMAELTVRLSPTGARFAIPDRRRDAATGTNIYLNGTLTGAATGWPVGWIDGDHLLVNRYNGSGNNLEFAGANVTDAAGLIQTTPALDELRDLQPVGPNLVYAARRNAIFDTTTGNPVWDSFAPHDFSTPLGVVVGNDVWFVSGSTIRVEPR